MEHLPVLCHLLLLCFVPTTATSLITGQRVCRVERGKPCYKLAYFSDPRRRLNFKEAELACRRDGGELLSVESASEQSIIEKLITELRPSDGDFWIGLRRNHLEQENSAVAVCSAQYYWLDGSKAAFRNWHWDEPSCGYEVCVVMYHQPSVSGDPDVLYMFQWNDDNCETKNNFICKYTTEKSLDSSPSPNYTQTEAQPTLVLPGIPTDRKEKRTALDLIFIIIPTIPLLLLLLTVTGVCCFKMCVRRKRREQKSEVCQTELGLSPSPTSSDIYNVIRSQKDDDLAEPRPNTKNKSFLCSSPDTPTGDYDNLGGRDTESGFATLASTESGYLNFDLNDLSLGRRATRDFYDASLNRPGKRDSYDASLNRPGKRDSYDASLNRPGKTDSYDASLNRPGKRDSYDASLIHLGKRDSYDGSLSRCVNRELYDKSLGRRTTKSEHYSGSSGYVGQAMRESSLTGRCDIYNPCAVPRACTVKAELYQTYMTNGKEDTYQTKLGYFGSHNSYQTNTDCFRNDISLSGGRRYFNESEWVHGKGY